MVQFFTGKVRSILASGVLLALLISVIVAFTVFTSLPTEHVRTDMHWDRASQGQNFVIQLCAMQYTGAQGYLMLLQAHQTQ